jgi:hypothetical protein
MKWSERNMDQVIFDYLEGDLPAEEKVQFEVEALRDDVLKEELELWQASYVSSDSYDTSLLENSLLSVPKITPFSSFTFYLNTVLILAISFVSSSRVKIEPEAFTVRNTIPTIEIVAKSPVLNSEVFAPSLPNSLILTPETSHVNDPALDFSYNREEIILESLETQQMIWSRFQMNPAKPIEIKSIKLPAKPKEKDRRTLRQIERMKGRFERERKAAEFMRGDIPYVVPVDTQNF